MSLDYFPRHVRGSFYSDIYFYVDMGVGDAYSKILD